VAQPWEKLTGESAQAFQAFALYRDMGPDRSLAKVAKELGKSSTIVERWSARDAWVVRVEAWDVEQDRLWRQQQLNSRREVGKRHLRIANAMQGKLVDALARLDVSQMTPADIARWIEVTAKVQRQAIGLGDHTVVSGPDGGPVELAHLSPDEARSRLAEVSAEIQRRLASDPDAVPLEGALEASS
jgi:hypothetical protein